MKDHRSLLVGVEDDLRSPLGMDPVSRIVRRSIDFRKRSESPARTGAGLSRRFGRVYHRLTLRGGVEAGSTS
ncbi:MAG: hypothetical protein SFX72_08460 [Isosphaeraceae bacterium]|nr:hypothetical protein [Isosphaeraceae bacterium]